MPAFNFNKICQGLLKDLSSRQKEVILRRFGLVDGKKETLESIGKDFGITRERVRQIEEDGFSRLKPRIKEYQGVFSFFEKYLKNQGDLKKEKVLLSDLGGKNYQPQVYFLLTVGEPFLKFQENKEYHSAWGISDSAFERAQKINSYLIQKFREIKTPLELREIYQIYKKEILPQTDKALTEKALLSHLEISKQIQPGERPTLFGLWEWPEINPRGVKDRAYLVLKKAQKPLHFTEVCLRINNLKIGRSQKTHPQTVHNELIRDSRFVLVGKGLYALAEWGYVPGTIRDIICKVLKEEKRPLPAKEIVKKVLKQRLVKEQSILFNLQNKKYFQRVLGNKYTLREA